MKLFILLSTLLLSSLSIYSQTNEFAPVGARWWYGIQNEITGLISYKLYEAEKDTIIDGIQAIKISLINVEPDGSSVLIASEYFARDSSKISIYRNGYFIDIINYNSEMGDTIIVFDEPYSGFFDFSSYTYEYFSYIIDSVSLEIYDGHFIKTLYVNNIAESDYHFGNLFSASPVILQNIGSIEDFCFIGLPNDISIFGIPLGLICYETDSYNISFNNKSCDSILNDISIGSNPTLSFKILYSNNHVHITTNNNQHCNILLASMNLITILKESYYGSFTIDAALYPDGMYLLLIFNNDNKLIFSETIFL